MPQPTQLLADLLTASEQQLQAARGGDWDLVTRLQQHRTMLLEALTAYTENAHIAPEATADLNIQTQVQSLYRMETELATLAKRHHHALGNALERLEHNVPKSNENRATRAYRNVAGPTAYPQRS